MRGLFVTGTDTGVGKSVLSAALLATIVAAGEPVRAHKPVVTGLDAIAASGARAPAAGSPDCSAASGSGAAWPPDHVLLARAAGMAPEDVAPLRYGPAVAPHLAASLAGQRIDPASLLAAARGAGLSERQRPPAGEPAVIVEGVGGLLVPLADDYTVRDLAAQLGLPLLIAARPGLGTINHTLLTLAAARAVGLDVRAVVLTPWAATPSTLERSNRETIARGGAIEVHGLPLTNPDPAALARAGARLPWRGWVADAA